MKQYNSLQEMELDLKRLDLQKQITKEQIKQNNYLLKKSFRNNVVSSNLVKKVSSIAFIYLLRKIKSKI
ncbi:hypothetical protein KXJ69_10875 [Aureisphaera sp. CAU 1614]|uniref:Uncharacterized protein n=1 Tax=Halomarinibacterium sedimenti TaxID=2857106 RepID=A0A9X1JZM2_9FLAO|nr:hypothetical protein [Halomarinibacterium sedimenti]MBW2938612.1 hypothetical protein [Halomarinibacterium sedimenti]